jgi:hypothetical protein
MRQVPAAEYTTKEQWHLQAIQRCFVHSLKVAEKLQLVPINAVVPNRAGPAKGYSAVCRVQEFRIPQQLRKLWPDGVMARLVLLFLPYELKKKR